MRDPIISDPDCDSGLPWLVDDTALASVGKGKTSERFTEHHSN